LTHIPLASHNTTVTFRDTIFIGFSLVMSLIGVPLSLKEPIKIPCRISQSGHAYIISLSIFYWWIAKRIQNLPRCYCSCHRPFSQACESKRSLNQLSEF